MMPLTLAVDTAGDVLLEAEDRLMLRLSWTEAEWLQARLRELLTPPTYPVTVEDE